MPYNLLMPEKEDHRSPQLLWLSVWRRRWWIALAMLFILVWWLAPPLLYRHTGTPKADKLKAITDTRTALLAGLIGVGALLTFWLNSRVYRITAETLRVTEQGQLTDRYTKAIEQLGSDKLDVRLGGIYALERIAKDSERDHPTVVEVLSAFVREHSDPAHIDAEPSVAKGRSTFLQGDSEATVERQPGVEQPSRKPRPTTDVRAALTVLGRLAPLPGVRAPDIPLRADLRNAYFVSADLRAMNLSGFHLTTANLREANLELADLRMAWLGRANLREAKLWRANLERANLSEAHLEGANLRMADLAGAQLREANLRGVQLEGGVLSGAHLEGANLRMADLRKAWLGADLRGANLEGANLEGAHLEGVDLRRAEGLTQAQLETAFLDSESRLPPELQGRDSEDGPNSG